MAKNREEFAARLRVHCSAEDLQRWRAAMRVVGAPNFSAWVRSVLDQEAALAMAAARNPWVDRRTGRARQIDFATGQLASGNRRKIMRSLATLADESEGL